MPFATWMDSKLMLREVKLGRQRQVLHNLYLESKKVNLKKQEIGMVITKGWWG